MIIDLHCDLLSHPTFSSTDPAVRCSPEQLISGGVSVQVCAMYTDHYQSCKEHTYTYQNQMFVSLPQTDSRISLLSFDTTDLQLTGSQSLQCIRSIENASLLGDNDEKLDNLLARLVHTVLLDGPLAYIGMVWNFKNRFGGGCLEKGGLSQDGRDLLEVMSILGIALDISHCSDLLAEDILDYRVNKLPNLPILASHSNFRSVTDHCRNLVDEHVKEIVKHGGIIGLNLLRNFLGESLEDIKLHLEHAQKLDIIDHLSLGTDFFYSDENDKFFSECATAQQHPIVHAIIQHHTTRSESASILYQSAKTFLLQCIAKQKEGLRQASTLLNSIPKTTKQFI